VATILTILLRIK